MKIKLNKNTIFNLYIIAIFLDAYCFTMMGERGITIWYVITALLVSFSFFFRKLNLKKNFIAILMIVYMIYNYSVLGQGALTSLMAGLTCWIMYLFSYRKCSISDFDKQVKLFQKMMNFFLHIWNLSADWKHDRASVYDIEYSRAYG